MKKSKSHYQKLLITTLRSGRQIIINQMNSHSDSEKLAEVEMNGQVFPEIDIAEELESTQVLIINDISNPIRRFLVQNLISQLQQLIEEELEKGNSDLDDASKFALDDNSIFDNDDGQLLFKAEKLIEAKEQPLNTVSTDFLDHEKPPRSTEDPFLQRVREYVLANLNESDFGNTELARKMHLSESQLYRKIKASTGRSVAIYARSIRLQKAKELLLKTEFTIGQIAYKTGFNDPSYFGRSFSKEFGISPSKFRT